jgi:hypothetical protein
MLNEPAERDAWLGADAGTTLSDRWRRSTFRLSPWISAKEMIGRLHFTVSSPRRPRTSDFARIAAAANPTGEPPLSLGDRA